MGLIAAGELGCVYTAGAPGSVALSDVALPYCDTFANSGLSDGGVTDLLVAEDGMHCAVFSGATYDATGGTFSLPSPPTKAIGTLTDGATVRVLGVLTTALQPGEELTQAEDQRLFGFLPGAAETTIAFDDSTYEFTLTPVGQAWTYYRDGMRCTVTGAKSITLPGAPPAAGVWWISIDDEAGTLEASQSPWVIGPTSTSVMVAYIEWNAANTPKFLLYDERHPADLSRGEHAYLHSTRGAMYASGGAISGYTLQDAGATTNNTIGIAEGVFYDETLKNTVAALTDPNGVTTPYLIKYRDGTGSWDWHLSEVPYPYASGAYIQVDNPAGTLTNVNATGRYLNSWLLMTGAGWQIVAPQVNHANLSNAAAELFSSLDLTAFNAAEYVAIWKLTWRTGSGYTTLGKVRLEAVTQINVSSIPGSSQQLTAANVSVAATPTNYTATTPDVEAHLAGIDAAVGLPFAMGVGAKAKDATGVSGQMSRDGVFLYVCYATNQWGRAVMETDY